jgi:predicted LPLAT superfamily acyltransferase
MSAQWRQQREGGGRFSLWLIRFISLHFGRGFARIWLHPIAIYYFLRRGPERRASRQYLERITGMPVSHAQVIHHIHCFAATLLDRIFLLARGDRDFEIEVEGLELLHETIDRGKGVLLVGSHQGSFEALRAISQRRPDVPLRVVLDKQKTPAMTKLLEALAPQVGASVIDASRDGTSITLAMAEATSKGEMVALLADRARPGEHCRHAEFLGRSAPFPIGPWLLASVLKVPVVLCFGLYMGGNRYKLIFEAMADRVEIPRAHRAHALDQLISRYAQRLEHYAHVAPYNWFNFYDFWHDDAGHAGMDHIQPSGAGA